MVTAKIPGSNQTFRGAEKIVFGAPFDGTVSYRPGARFGPAAVRSEFYGVETYSPLLGKDMEEDLSLHDAGDLDLPMGNTGEALKAVEKISDRIHTAGKKPFMIGGEHLVTLPAFKSAYKRYGGSLALVHFDAHTDLRTDYLGQKLSHASVVRRVWELTGDGHIYQFGIRSGLRDEFEWAAAGHTKLSYGGFEDLEDAVRVLRGVPVYFTVDLDVLDPSAFPGTGTPEPGGVTYRELEAALKLVSQLDIVAADMVEFAPNCDPGGVNGGISAATACKVMREMLLML